ncbi:MAG: hypothetical protein HOQ05_13670 [Corynebacteriales bacterium]|nr:hypothetical protein [Mycobacteriales bacterium]
MTRRIQVSSTRLERWLSGFHDRHQIVKSVYYGNGVKFLGINGDEASVEVPYGAIPVQGERDGFAPEPLLSHASRSLRLGMVLVRLGGYAVGVFDGPTLVVSKVDSRLVHGRHKKGGSSSGRFARRRENEVRQLVNAAADTTARVVLPRLASLEAVVVGGDRAAVAQVLADKRLSACAALVRGPFLSVPDPKLRILQESYEKALAVTIDIRDGQTVR